MVSGEMFDTEDPKEEAKERIQRYEANHKN